MKNVEVGFKNIKVKFSDEVENTQSTFKKSNHPDDMPTDFFSSNGRQDIVDGRLDKNNR